MTFCNGLPVVAILDFDKFVRNEKLPIPRLMFKMDFKIISFKLELDRKCRYKRCVMFGGHLGFLKIHQHWKKGANS